MIPMNFEVYQDMERTFTPDGVGCSSVNRNNYWLDGSTTGWPPAFTKPYGWFDDTHTYWDV